MEMNAVFGLVFFVDIIYAEIIDEACHEVGSNQRPSDQKSSTLPMNFISWYLRGSGSSLLILPVVALYGLQSDNTVYLSLDRHDNSSLICLLPSSVVGEL